MADEIEVTIKMTVDEDWVDTLLNYSDIFRTDHCGYWLHGVEQKDGLGWLTYEMGDNEAPRGKKREMAIEAWENNRPLPDGFMRLDRSAAIKAQKAIVEKYGKDMWDNAPDAMMQDVGIQLALLGEIRYG